MRNQKILPTALAVLMILPAVLTLGPAPPAEASGCWVKNVRARTVGGDLQGAIDASEQGDVIRLRGICGAFSTDDQVVTLVGPATIGYPDTAGYPTEILAQIHGGKVTLKNLFLVGGYSTFYGGAILNDGNLILKGYTRVSDNLAEDGGGGIYNEGRLVLRDNAKVVRNEILFGFGGGIWNAGTLIMRDNARVAGNDGFPDGGGVYNAGTLIMRNAAAIKHNRARTGGGVYSTGSLRMSGASRITRNTASGGTGGGLYSEGTEWFSPWWRGTLCGNTPDDWPSCSP